MVHSSYRYYFRRSGIQIQDQYIVVILFAMQSTHHLDGFSIHFLEIDITRTCTTTSYEYNEISSKAEEEANKAKDI